MGQSAWTEQASSSGDAAAEQDPEMVEEAAAAEVATAAAAKEAAEEEEVYDGNLDAEGALDEAAVRRHPRAAQTKICPDQPSGT